MKNHDHQKFQNKGKNEPWCSICPSWHVYIILKCVCYTFLAFHYSFYWDCCWIKNSCVGIQLEAWRVKCKLIKSNKENLKAPGGLIINRINYIRIRKSLCFDKWKTRQNKMRKGELLAGKHWNSGLGFIPPIFHDEKPV